MPRNCDTEVRNTAVVTGQSLLHLSVPARGEPASGPSAELSSGLLQTVFSATPPFFLSASGCLSVDP